MVKEMISSYCGAYPVKSYCKDSKISDTKGPRKFYSFLSDLIKIWSSLCGQHLAKIAYFENLNISGTERYLCRP